MTPPSPSSAFPTAPSSQIAVHRSPWHSPVPYLFGGLSVMMALIAFALFILACSYWKLSRRLQDSTDADPERDLEVGAGVVNVPDGKKIFTSFEEMFVVVMAGDKKPTFLATPSSSRTSSFGSNSCRSSLATTDDSSVPEMEKDETGDRGQVSTTGSHESVEHES